MRHLRRVTGSLSAWILCVACASWALGVDSPGFERTLSVSLKDPVSLDIAVAKGNVTVAYNRDGQVAIYAVGHDGNGKTIPSEFFEATLTIEQAENRITIRNAPDASRVDSTFSISYRINVPFRTEVSSTILGAGNQVVIGIVGPAKLVTAIGDIDASYIRYGVVKAETGKGRISCSRVAQVDAETGSGNITLMETGPSRANVKRGPGRIEVGGARGSFKGSTDQGELHIKAVLWDDWELNSISGNIRIELPPKPKFDADLATKSGTISFQRPDMEQPAADDHTWHQQVNGGGKHIQARSNTGNIVLE